MRLVRVEIGAQRRARSCSERCKAVDDLDVRRLSASQTQTGSGVPQYRSREMAQSMLPRQPLAEPARPDFRRVPPHAAVARQHRIAERRRPHEPGRPRVVQERSAAPPAMRIRVRQPLGSPQQPGLLEDVDDGARPHPSRTARRQPARRPRERAAARHRLKKRQAISLAGGIVVGSERRRHVHDAAAVFGRHERSRRR